MRHASAGHHDAVTVLFDRYHLLVYDVAVRIVRDARGSGFELLERLPNESAPVVIFSTAFAQFAAKAFDVQACDYRQPRCAIGHSRN